MGKYKIYFNLSFVAVCYITREKTRAMKPSHNSLSKSFKYFLFTVPVIPITILVLDYIERNAGFHTWTYKGDIDAFVSVMTVGTLSYLIGNRVLYKDLNDQRLWRQHFSQSFVNYLISIVLLIFLAVGYQASRGSLGYGLLTITFLAVIWGTLINLFCVLIKKHSRKIESSDNRG